MATVSRCCYSMAEWESETTGVMCFRQTPPGYRVIVPDLRGHGRSTNPGGAFTFRQCAQDVLALLDGLGLDRTKAIGLSMGAKTLLHADMSNRRGSRPWSS